MGHQGQGKRPRVRRSAYAEPRMRGCGDSPMTAGRMHRSADVPIDSWRPGRLVFSQIAMCSTPKQMSQDAAGRRCANHRGGRSPMRQSWLWEIADAPMTDAADRGCANHGRRQIAAADVVHAADRGCRCPGCGRSRMQLLWLRQIADERPADREIGRCVERGGADRGCRDWEKRRSPIADTLIRVASDVGNGGCADEGGEIGHGKGE
jgi:hypothetical protein